METIHNINDWMRVLARAVQERDKERFEYCVHVTEECKIASAERTAKSKLLMALDRSVDWEEKV